MNRQGIPARVPSPCTETKISLMLIRSVETGRVDIVAKLRHGDQAARIEQSDYLLTQRLMFRHAQVRICIEKGMSIGTRHGDHGSITDEIRESELRHA
jgi:hypothetical protein